MTLRLVDPQARELEPRGALGLALHRCPAGEGAGRLRGAEKAAEGVSMRGDGGMLRIGFFSVSIGRNRLSACAASGDV